MCLKAREDRLTLFEDIGLGKSTLLLQYGSAVGLQPTVGDREAEGTGAVWVRISGDRALNSCLVIR